MHRVLLSSLLLLAGCATTGSTAFYPLEELRALDAPESRAEVLARALEVAPSKRDDTWRGVVERAAVATLAAIEVNDASTAEQALALTDTQPERFPFLLRSDAWLAQRAELGVKALPHVAQRGERGTWPRRVLAFARVDARTRGLAQRLADEVLLKQLIPSTAAPLYELAFAREGAAVCDSPTVTAIALAWAAEGESFKPAFEHCWARVQGPLVEAVKAAETRTFKLNACKAMASRQAEAAVKTACAD
jgi:hypothetical protein